MYCCMLCWFSLHYLFVNLPLFQPMNPVPQQCTFVRHSPERSGEQNTQISLLYNIPVPALLKENRLSVSTRTLRTEVCCQKRGTELRLLSPVIEETGFVSLHDDNVKQVPPVLPHNVVHSPVAERGKKTDSWVSNILMLIMRVNKHLGWEDGNDTFKFGCNSPLSLAVCYFCCSKVV